MKRFFRELITKRYRFNVILIILEADMIIICSVLLMFIQGNEAIVKYTLTSMAIDGLVMLATILQTLNKMKKVRVQMQMLQLEKERQLKVKERESIHK